MTQDEIMEKGVRLLILGLKLAKPDLTDEEAENVIINVGMYLEMKRLKRKE
jgi:hypothetical protein